jgi:hypothetical protein
MYDFCEKFLKEPKDLEVVVIDHSNMMDIEEVEFIPIEDIESIKENKKGLFSWIRKKKFKDFE